MNKNQNLKIDSKFPNVGTTIFTVMSKLATDCGAINLSQGFPDFQADPALFEAAHKAMSAGLIPVTCLSLQVVRLTWLCLRVVYMRWRKWDSKKLY